MRIRGTQPTQPQSLEVGKDTVYVRSDIERIETEDFSGWEYTEVQYKKDDFIVMLDARNQALTERSDFHEEVLTEIILSMA